MRQNEEKKKLEEGRLARGASAYMTWRLRLHGVEVDEKGLEPCHRDEKVVQKVVQTLVHAPPIEQLVDFCDWK